MKSRIASGIMLTLLLIGMCTLAFNIQTVKTEPRTWTVDDDGPADFSSIWDAINSPQVVDGDTIFVKAGVYYGFLSVDKALSLVGENTVTTIIDGGGIYTDKSNVTISGFTIRNGFIGIQLQIDWDTWTYPQRVEISRNVIANNTHIGILLRGFRGIICNNTIVNNREGIYFDVASHNNISYNTIASNHERGIQIGLDSSGNVFRHNNLSGNGWNFGVFAGSLHGFRQDIDSSNTVDERPIYYFVDERDKQVPAYAGYVAAIDCVNITVRDLSLTNNLQGVLFAWTTNSIIENVNVSNNWIGIHLMLGSSQNIIYDNTIRNNEWRGIELMTGCSQNNISRNRITSNNPIHTSNTPWFIPWFTPKMGIGVSLAGWSHENILNNNWITLNECGIYMGSEWDWDPLQRPDNNSISENTIVNNHFHGIYLSYSSGNIIFHNNFIDNTQQVNIATSGYDDIWDDGYPSGGNYWSDYSVRYPLVKDEYQGENQDVLGSDGMWDSPYEIDDDNQDRYPLVEPWSPLPKTIDELKTEIEKCWSEGEIDNKGIVKSLVVKLNVAQKLVDKGKTDEATSILEDDFIPQVQNLTDIHITPEAADILIQSAEYILSHL